MKLNMSYKLFKTDADWSIMTIDTSWFSPNWDSDQVLSELFEYAFTNLPGGEDDEEVEIKDMVVLSEVIFNHLHDIKETEAQLAFRKELLAFELADEANSR